MGVGKPIDIVERETLRQRGPRTRRTHFLGGAVWQASFDDEKPVEPAYGRDDPRDGPGREPSCDATANKGLNRPTVERLGRTADRTRKCSQRPDVASVAIKGMRGQSTLDPEVFEVPVVGVHARIPGPSTPPRPRRRSTREYATIRGLHEVA